MPDIDVGDIILDGTVSGEEFMVIRRREIVGQTGFRTNTVERFTSFGSITPTGDNSMVRDEAYAAQNKSIRVITKFLLRGPAKDTPPSGAPVTRYDADIVVWKGDSFIVKTLDDYSQFGGGFVEAECTSYDYVDQPPSETTDG